MKDEKDALRDRMRRRRQAMPEEERARLGALAAGHLLGSPLWGGAACVALYVAVRGECDTSALLARAWAEGKQVLLPRCLPEKPGLMRLTPCPGPEALRPGAYGIPEPVRAPEHEASGRVDKKNRTADAVLEPDLILVPGLAFDRRGQRLGQGGGYYDRLLADPFYARSFCLGFAYALQIVEHLPTRSWDRPVRAVCTEEGMLWTA